MTNGQRKARNAQRWLSGFGVLMLLCGWTIHGKPIDHAIMLSIICWVGVVVIDAMRALSAETALKGEG